MSAEGLGGLALKILIGGAGIAISDADPLDVFGDLASEFLAEAFSPEEPDAPEPPDEFSKILADVLSQLGGASG